MTWWTTPPQGAQLFHSGEIDIMPTFSNRAYQLIAQGDGLAICWNQAFYNSYGWVIPKGNPKAELTRRLIVFSLEPESQAARCAKIGAGPSNVNAYQFMSKDVSR
ncbi:MULTISPECIES: extracellular solute-binding protein [Bradyrhizobium]|uniref:Extracellular solute-binding protein n=2 Tax=Bradyrhizobium TaxID=374 RepID=A0A9X1RCG0_9BRAD|nr:MULTISPECIES: extracellular solute-binding protein [Bradyrhizobium]MCG2629381.1 extracellular solute-binding protein [Bradyrhizobium zhengyangense]MCG2644662.1 extracellular solute-binding protein [Bradyrhizobium zhengyangense]MCG2670895.1 extracellular solute-binding protein [Bradyrhizobium zhengyangense]GGI27548.1 hypothetical protein GCM10010987_44940 [Bradyrhizobium guangdongense]